MTKWVVAIQTGCAKSDDILLHLKVKCFVSMDRGWWQSCQHQVKYLQSACYPNKTWHVWEEEANGRFGAKKVDLPCDNESMHVEWCNIHMTECNVQFSQFVKGETIKKKHFKQFIIVERKGRDTKENRTQQSINRFYIEIVISITAIFQLQF